MHFHSFPSLFLFCLTRQKTSHSGRLGKEVEEKKESRIAKRKISQIRKNKSLSRAVFGRDERKRGKERNRESHEFLR